jgi:hypothetical protein
MPGRLTPTLLMKGTGETMFKQMFKTTIMKRLPLVMLLVGLCAGVAGAQIFRNLHRVQIINSGLFTVPPGGSANFFISFDERQDGLPTNVSLRLFDEHGAVKAADDVTLRPGQSTKISVNEEGLYRAHAEAWDPSFGLGARREVVGRVELLDDLLLVTGGVCAPGKGIGGERD